MNLTKKWREEHPELITGENSAQALLEKIKKEKEKSPAPKNPTHWRDNRRGLIHQTRNTGQDKKPK